MILGRDDQLQTFALLLARMAAGRTEQSMIITGLRGVGKTVLLGSFRTEALGQNWVVIENEVEQALGRSVPTRPRVGLSNRPLRALP